MVDKFKALSAQEINDLQAAAVMTFVNTQVGAFEAGFVEGSELSLYSLYRFAQLHIKDNYGIDIEPIADAWGADLADLARSDDERD